MSWNASNNLCCWQPEVFAGFSWIVDQTFHSWVGWLHRSPSSLSISPSVSFIESLNSNQLLNLMLFNQIYPVSLAVMQSPAFTKTTCCTDRDLKTWSDPLSRRTSPSLILSLYRDCPAQNLVIQGSMTHHKTTYMSLLRRQGTIAWKRWR